MDRLPQSFPEVQRHPGPPLGDDERERSAAAAVAVAAAAFPPSSASSEAAAACVVGSALAASLLGGEGLGVALARVLLPVLGYACSHARGWGHETPAATTFSRRRETPPSEKVVVVVVAGLLGLWRQHPISSRRSGPPRWTGTKWAKVGDLDPPGRRHFCSTWERPFGESLGICSCRRPCRSHILFLKFFVLFPCVLKASGPAHLCLPSGGTRDAWDQSPHRGDDAWGHPLRWSSS